MQGFLLVGYDLNEKDSIPVLSIGKGVSVSGDTSTLVVMNTITGDKATALYNELIGTNDPGYRRMIYERHLAEEQSMVEDKYKQVDLRDKLLSDYGIKDGDEVEFRNGIVTTFDVKHYGGSAFVVNREKTEKWLDYDVIHINTAAWYPDTHVIVRVNEKLFKEEV